MEFETLKKSHKKQIIIGALAVCIIGGALTFNLTRAKYKVTESIPLVKGNINYQVPDMRVIAINVSEDGTNYNIADEIPTGEYTLNTDKTMCKVATETSGIENAHKDNNITFEYVDNKINIRGVSKRNTRCYLYFDKVLDTEKPIISNVTTSVTKTEINVTVTASDNKGVTEYWYQLGSNAAVKGTGNTYKFTGLTAGTTYSVKVYVKDEAGNTSDISTKIVTTTKPTASESILGNITYKTTTPDFSQVATTDEGIYRVSDGMYGGYSYYWRGAVTNNYVKFANFCWRIVRINGDGSIRLIYGGDSTCNDSSSIAVSNQKYNPGYNSNVYVGWTYTSVQHTLSGTDSNAKKQTDTWYNNNIGNNEAYSNKVTDGKFCNDRDITAGYTWAPTANKSFGYAAHNRANNPSLSCNIEDTYILKAGAITVDEAKYAGGTTSTGNTLYYLHNGQAYWTMSPAYWTYRNSESCDVHIFIIGATTTHAARITDLNPTSNIGIRPVINLKADTTFSSGDGTLDNPYVVQ